MYDYSTRFGFAGRLFDLVLFRPLMGWATAWSFDRLRLWLEKQIDPAASLRQSLAYGLSRVTVAFVWIYQGLIPKLLAPNADEKALLLASGLAPEYLDRGLMAIGLVEVAFGVALLLAWRSRSLFGLTAMAMVIALVTVTLTSPGYLTGAFNPVTLNLAMIALSLIGLMTGKDLTSAKRCKRRKSGDAK